MNLQRGPLRTTAGFTIDAPHGLATLRKAQTIIVPSWRDDGEPAPAELLRALQAAHRRGATIVGLCLGAFVLAEAGLLDGPPATTHWHLVPEFARRFPQVPLQPEVLYVDHGDVRSGCWKQRIVRWSGSRPTPASARQWPCASSSARP